MLLFLFLDLYDPQIHAKRFCGTDHQQDSDLFDEEPNRVIKSTFEEIPGRNIRYKILHQNMNKMLHHSLYIRHQR